MRLLLSILLVLFFCNGCGFGLGPFNERRPLKPDTNAQISGNYCSNLESQLYSWLDQNSRCTVDSECRTQYGGCLRLSYNASTNLQELNRRVDQWNNQCASQRGMCGIPPGAPVCDAGQCSAR